MKHFQSPIEQAARNRIASNPSLNVYYDIIQWGDSGLKDHYMWLLAASDDDILRWAQGVSVEWEFETDLGYKDLFGADEYLV